MVLTYFSKLQENHSTQSQILLSLLNNLQQGVIFMQNFGANVASCDEDLMIRFANRKALEVIAPEEISKTASRTKEGTSIDVTIDQPESSKFNLESFQNQEQAFENTIQSSVRFVPYLVDHNSI